MAEIYQPEILPPRRAMAANQINDEQLEHLASILDDLFSIPGTEIRFGLDALIGLIPGIGDLITALMSFLIVFAAWQRGLPQVTIARMVANITIDTVVGAIPILGDTFDVMWKSNRKNYNLLRRSTEQPEHARAHTVKDWAFLVLLIIAGAILIAAPIVMLTLLVQKLWA
jgi:hypothetical protein